MVPTDISQKKKSTGSQWHLENVECQSAKCKPMSYHRPCASPWASPSAPDKVCIKMTVGYHVTQVRMAATEKTKPNAGKPAGKGDPRVLSWELNQCRYNGKSRFPQNTLNEAAIRSVKLLLGIGRMKLLPTHAMSIPE